jgi:hypothetical protein
MGLQMTTCFALFLLSEVLSRYKLCTYSSHPQGEIYKKQAQVDVSELYGQMSVTAKAPTFASFPLSLGPCL